MLVHVEAMMSLLATDEPLVLDEPFEVYLTYYRVLEASGDVGGEPVAEGRATLAGVRRAHHG
jgi:hypothetical protein